MIALGGNALLERKDKPDASVQRRHIRRAAAALAPLAAEHQLIICHGNGPQVGLLALESESDTTLSRAYPLDVLGAQTQGMIGYWLTQELHNAGVGAPAIAIVTQTVVDPTDAAFESPTKFVGATYGQAQVSALSAERGWRLARDGAAWRRVVPSPEPVRIIEEETVRSLLDCGTHVVCGGGGGAPVIEKPHGQLGGVEAVVDKDYVAAMLAVTFGADRLLLLTDVPAVMTNFGTPEAAAVHRLELLDLDGMQFPAGSMGPKIEACRRFVSATGSTATIGALDDCADLLAGTAGTSIDPGTASPAGSATATGARERVTP
jgi:carbamate kinase